MRIFAVLALTAAAGLVQPAQAQGAAGAAPEPDATRHFDPLGKPASKFTLELRNGFKARLPYKQIKADAGHVAWDTGSCRWLLAGKDFPSIHPSLQRQAVLNMAYGLHEVVPGRIYQMRGLDLANISFVKGDTGWIVFDPLTAAETARAASWTRPTSPAARRR